MITINAKTMTVHDILSHDPGLYELQAELYTQGLAKPNYPVPAPLWISDTATGWDKLNWTCCPCMCHFTDQLWDDYYISKGNFSF